MGYSPFRAHRLSFEILMAENKEGKVQEGQGQGLGAVFGCSLRAGAHRWVLSYRGEVIPELAEAGRGGDMWQDGALRRRAGGRLANAGMMDAKVGPGAWRRWEQAGNRAQCMEGFQSSF